MRLRLTVGLGDMETPTSFLSRFAARNGVGARRLCSDFGIHFQGIVDGEKCALGHLAGLAGVDGELLAGHSFRRLDGRKWHHRGEELDRITLRRMRIDFCPACALEDIRRQPDLRPAVAIQGRSLWSVEALGTCCVHAVPLITAPALSKERFRHDFAAHMTPLADHLDRLLAQVEPRAPDSFERYVESRLDGARRSPMFDPIPLGPAMRLAGAVGAVILFGPSADLKRLDQPLRRRACATGFDAIRAGTEAFGGVVDGMMQTAGSRERLDGPSRVLSHLYLLLRSTIREPSLDAARATVRESVLRNLPLAEGRSIFGEVVGRRRVHSVHSLAKEAAVHPKRLRKHLRAAGIIGDGQLALSDHNIRLDAVTAAAITTAAAGTISRNEAGRRIDAPRTQMTVLIKAGLIKPADFAGAGAHDRYAVVELDAFLDTLKRHRLPESARRHACDIPTAAKRACCSAATIVRLIQEGMLPTASSPKSGYLGVLVDGRAAQKLARGPDTGGMSIVAAQHALGTTDRVVKGLIRHGHLATFTAPNPVNHRLQTLVTAEEIRRFADNYVSLWALATSRRAPIAQLVQNLRSNGIRPIFDPEGVGATFYARADVQGLG